GSCATADSTPSVKRTPTSAAGRRRRTPQRYRPVRRRRPSLPRRWSRLADPTTDLPERPCSESHHDHRDVSGGWLRPTVFGMMDGLVTNFALLLGLSGGHASHRFVVLGGLASLLAGSLSMASGEYISVLSQNESTRAEVEIERHELKHNAAAELLELTQMYISRGVDPVTA